MQHMVALDMFLAPWLPWKQPAGSSLGCAKLS